jgi:hypothetical protein
VSAHISEEPPLDPLLNFWDNIQKSFMDLLGATTDEEDPYRKNVNSKHGGQMSIARMFCAPYIQMYKSYLDVGCVSES